MIQIPLMILCKSAVVLEDEHYSEILPLSWQLLLDRNEELVSCAGKSSLLSLLSSLIFLATIILLTAARAAHLIDPFIHKEMTHPSTLIRYNSILRFMIIWRFRSHFWIRLEENAHSMMKVEMKYLSLIDFLTVHLDSSTEY